MKQMHRNLFKAMLLPAIVLLLALWLSAGVVAGSNDTVYTLTLEFSDKITSYTVEAVHPSTGEKAVADVKDADGDGRETVDIVYDSTVTLTVNPATGYWPESATCTGGENPRELQGNVMKWSNYDASYTVAVVCADREYKVIAENLDGSPAPLDYVIDDSDWTLGLSALSDGTLKYKKGSGVVVELPKVSLANHTFEGWNIIVGATTVPVPVSNGKYYIPNDLTIASAFDEAGGEIRVRPILNPVTYEVWREDYVYDSSVSGNRGELLLQPPVSTTLTAGTLISAIKLEKETWYEWADDVNGYRQYPGYVLLEDLTQYEPHRVSEPTENNKKYNTVIRFYVPISYALTYLDDDGKSLTAFGAASEYVYGNATSIVAPTRAGYTFAGWTVQVYKNGEWQVATQQTGVDFSFGGEKEVTYDGGVRNDPNAIYASDKQEDGTYEIRLVANWTPNEYTVSYDWNLDDADLGDLMDTLNDKLLSEYNSFVYASDPMENQSYVKLIPAPVRPGHAFDGWSLRYTNALGEVVTLPASALASMIDENGTFSLDTDAYPSDILLTAQWTPERYTVRLDLGHADAIPGATTTLTDVVYGQAFVLPDGIGSVIPTRRGYNFLGFYTSPNGQGTKYINADGTAVDTPWQTDDDESGSVTLYAHWEPNGYDTIISISGITGDVVANNVTITITPEGGESFTVLAGESFRIVYGTRFTVTITTQSGYKVVIPDGDSLSYATEYSKQHECNWIETNTITVKVLPVRVLNVSDVIVEYPTETFDGLAPGRYSVLVDGVQTVFQIVANQTTQQSIDPSWFGKTIQMVYCGDGSLTSDSDPVFITLAARPAKPSINSGANTAGEIKPIETFDSTITITMMEGIDASLYEFAVVEYGSGNAPIWQSSSNFEGVKPGTMYDIYVRIKATDAAPHGEEFVISLRTTHSNYIGDQKAIVEGYRPQASGALADAFLDDLLAKLDQLGKTNPVPDDFYAQVEALMAGIEDGLALANRKDSALESLAAVLAECKRAGDFGENEERLNGYYTAAIRAITEAESVEGVEACFNNTVAAMRQVPVMKIWDADVLITLESLLGLDQTTVLQLIRDEAFGELARAVHDAIRTSGKVKVDSFMTLAEAEKLLRALDVVAYYNFNMANSNTVQAGDTFLIRLTLPADLVGKTGLQVAYYNEQTGDVELLKTWLSEDGTTLIFEAKEVRNFVILADPTVNLTVVILTLGGVLLLQLIALAFLLYIRSENKKNALHASFALPAMLLTVHFAPANGEIIAMLLAAAVIIMQIVLIVLLLKSDMIYRFGRRREDEYESDVPAEETDTVPESVEDASAVAMTEPVEEDATLTAEALVLSDTLDETAETETRDDPFDFCEETTEDEDFIEPAATTRYSLPDDEMIVFEAEDTLHEAVTLSYEDASEQSFDEEIYAEESVDEDLFDEMPYVDESYPDAELDSDELLLDDEEEIYEDGAYAEEYPADEYADDEDASYGELPYIGELGDEATEEELEDVNALYGDEGLFLEEEETYDEEDATDEDADPFYGYDE